MAHAEGSIANACFFTRQRETVYGYERDIDGVYVGRRFCFSREFQEAEDLRNIVA